MKLRVAASRVALERPEPGAAQLRQTPEAHRREHDAADSNIAVEMASDKELTVRLLGDVGLPVPRNVLVRSVEEAVAAADRLGFRL
jgi:glutathione synthase/RimK-type ligase-like ATP-grasp enzyme